MYHSTASMSGTEPSWMEAHFMLCEHWNQKRIKDRPWAEKVVMNWQKKRCTKRGTTNEKQEVCEVLFEFYDPRRKNKATINEVLIPEDFLTQLYEFPDNCKIQVIDLHGPSFDFVSQKMTMFLKELCVNTTGMLPSSVSYLKNTRASKRGFRMDEGSSRYNYANKAIIYTQKEGDETYKVIFRVCPHIMQSQIASAIVYCNPEGAEVFETWGDRLFKDAGAFGEALVKSEVWLTEPPRNPDGGARGRIIHPLWRQHGNVYLAYTENTADDKVLGETVAQGLEERLGLQKCAELVKRVQLLPIPPEKKKKSASAAPAAAAAAEVAPAGSAASASSSSSSSSSSHMPPDLPGAAAAAPGHGSAAYGPAAAAAAASPQPSNDAPLSAPPLTLQDRLKALVKDAKWISLGPQVGGGDRPPVSGGDFANWTRLCIAGFYNGFIGSLEKVGEAHRALMQNQLLEEGNSVVIHWPPLRKHKPHTVSERIAVKRWKQKQDSDLSIADSESEPEQQQKPPPSSTESDSDSSSDSESDYDTDGKPKQSDVVEMSSDEPEQTGGGGGRG
eukprot:Cvel_12951.t1-p1 / transcript=Cvel_12951.t1 / gene=Cvel_12951 / organism=Chromera_velia_CCMP2878 / gene_product=hypothetical protein / transcript_product=hypothetical protein / location=Cvel_scaffold866:61083-65070(+) / protein_length=557 / sequence_SO=supercontig / SO=protein_coding / is_pseudo=false